MRYKAKYKPELICSKDSTRYVLNNAEVLMLNDQPKMVATDGRRLVVIPVEADESERGPIPPQALKFARQARVSKKTDTVVMGLNGSISFENGWTMPRENKEDRTPYPNIQNVIPEHSPTVRIGINAKQLHELAQALGDDVVILNITDAGGAIKVTLQRDEAFGVIMPFRIA